MRISRKRKLIVIAGVLVLAIVAVGVGLGAWSLGGTGNGAAKATTASNVTLADATAFTSADLYPGATGNLKLRVTNPNPFPVRITTVSGNGTITSDKGAACDATTGVTFTNTTGLSQAVAAGATVTFSLAGKVAMSNASDNSCQGAVFATPITLAATS
jgi:hypothetical protein